MFLINWEDIHEQGLTTSWKAPADNFSTLYSLQEEGVCRFSSEIDASLSATWVANLLQVEGTVESTVVLECSRCLKEFERTLRGHFDLTFTRELPEIGTVDEDEDDGYELSPEELGLVHVPEETIDLHDAYAEQLILALPTRPLCGSQCAGLCPSCGQDLNQAACGCQKDDFNNRFAALKNLKLDKD